MLRKLYDWTMRLAESDRAPHALFMVAFVESSFFPIPPHIMMIPMVLARRDQAWNYALIATIGSVLGGVAGYGIGYYLFEVIGRPVIEIYGQAANFATFADRYNEWGFWLVIFAGVTPFPYKVITIASGVTNLNFFEFILASIVARAAIFVAIAALLFWFGPPIKAFIERRFGLVTTAFMVLLIGGFVAVKYVL